MINMASYRNLRPSSAAIDEFYAKAAYLSVNQRSQEPGLPRGRPPRNRVLTATDVDKKFLDTIALLFAYFKPAPNRPDDHKFKTRHLTATSMRKTEDLVTIYVAKNGGPQDFGGNKDEQFADLLETWLNVHRKSNNPPQPPGMPFMPQRWSPRPIIKDEEFEAKLYDWWKSRLDYYEHQLRSNWCAGELKKVSDYYQKPCYDEKVDIGYFTSDWKDVNALVDQSNSTGHSILECLLNSSGIYQDVGRQVYPRVVDPLGAGANRFRKVIKSISFLLTIRHALDICRSFNYSLKGCRVKVEFEPVKERNVISTAGIIENLKAKQLKATPSVRSSFEKTISQIQSQKSIIAHFRCELQMLQKVHSQDDVVDYFGCSKRSCFLCWEILRGTHFITRDTHSKLYYKWYIPFNSAFTSTYQQLVILLSQRFSALTGQPLQESEIVMSETDSLISTRRREFQGDSTKEPVPHSLLKYLDNEACDFKCLHIPPTGEPEISSYKAYNLRTSAGVQSDIQTPIVNVEVGEGIEGDWWVSEIQLHGHDAFKQWAALPVRNWNAQHSTPILIQATQQKSRRLYVLVRDNRDAPQNEWCHSQIINFHSASGPGSSKYPSVWRGNMFLFFINSSGTQLENFHDADIKPALQAFLSEYLSRATDSSDSIWEQLEAQDLSHLDWTCPM